MNKKNVLKSIVLFLLVSISTFVVQLGTHKKSYNDCKAFEGTSENVICNVDSSQDKKAQEYIDGKYGSKKNYKFIGLVKSICVKSNNQNQSVLISNYLSTTGASAYQFNAGCCSQVAGAIMTKNFDELFDTEVDTKGSSVQAIFNNVMTISWSKGYYKSESGTSADKVDDMVTKTFEYYGSLFKGNRDKKDLMATIKSKTNDDRTLIFGTSDHSMVCTGYATYQYSYETTTGALWWKKKVTKIVNVDFIIVNDGWSSRYDYSLYPADLLGGCDNVKVDEK